jgi:hypothetical protein
MKDRRKIEGVKRKNMNKQLKSPYHTGMGFFAL